MIAKFSRSFNVKTPRLHPLSADAGILLIPTEPTEKWRGLMRSYRPNWRSWGISWSCSRLKEGWQTDGVARNVGFCSMDGRGSELQEELGPLSLRSERRQWRCFRVSTPFSRFSSGQRWSNVAKSFLPMEQFESCCSDVAPFSLCWKTERFLTNPPLEKCTLFYAGAS